jgi:Ca2+-binding RTX toxin-like protein
MESPGNIYRREVAQSIYGDKDGLSSAASNLSDVLPNSRYDTFTLTRLGDGKVVVNLYLTTTDDNGYVFNVMYRDVLQGVEKIEFNGTSFNVSELAQNNGTEESDTYIGGIGNDTFDGGDSDDFIRGESGDDLLYGGWEEDNLDGGSGNDTLFGGEGSDQLMGGLGDDVLDAGDGSDIVDGGSGVDLAILDYTRDAYYFESISTTELRVVEISTKQFDILRNVERVKFSDGTEGNYLPGDLIPKGATRGNDVLKGTDGIDVFGGMEGNDSISGFGSDDMLNGGAGQDTLDGGAGDDYLSGNTGNDSLRGGDGSDYLDGGTGADKLIGGLGDDIYIVDAKTDVVIELLGEGTDTIQTKLGSYSIKKLPHVENMQYLGQKSFTGTGNDLDNVMTNGSNDDVIFYGGVGNDTLNGGEDVVWGGGSTLHGEVGDDLLVNGGLSFGGAGNDTLDGGYKLYGGAGNDTLIDGIEKTGGSGSDLFVFTTADNVYSGNDWIRDFVSGEDKIALELDHFKQLSFNNGQLGAGLFYAGAWGDWNSSNAQAKLFYDTSTGLLIYDADGPTLHASQFETIIQLGNDQSHPTLTAADFMSW